MSDAMLTTNTYYVNSKNQIEKTTICHQPVDALE